MGESWNFKCFQADLVPWHSPARGSGWDMCLELFLLPYTRDQLATVARPKLSNNNPILETCAWAGYASGSFSSHDTSTDLSFLLTDFLLLKLVVTQQSSSFLHLSDFGS